MRYLNPLFLFLVIVGGLNWLLVGVAKFDLVAALTGQTLGETNPISSAHLHPRWHLRDRPRPDADPLGCTARGARARLAQPLSPAHIERRSTTMRGLRLSAAVAAAALSLAVVATPAAARQPGATIVDTAIAVNAATGEFDELDRRRRPSGARRQAGRPPPVHRLRANGCGIRGPLRRARRRAASMTSPWPRCGPSCSTTWRRASGTAATSSTATKVPDAQPGLPVPVRPGRVGLCRRCPDPLGGCRRFERRDPRHRQRARPGLTGGEDADRPAPCEAAGPA